MNTKSTSKNEKKNKYTALVYFHGMGEQKRYEEVSTLIDALEEYDRTLPPMDRHMDKHALEFEFEQPRSPGLLREIGYIRVPSAPKDGMEFRFYDAYYANITAGGVGPLAVFDWLLRLSLVPIKIMFTPWRSLPRLRRATLSGGWNRHNNAPGSQNTAYSQLLAAYEDFGSFDQQQKFRRGSFLNYLGSIRSADAGKQSPSRLDAWLWFLRFIKVQVIITWVVFSMLLTLSMVIALVLALLLQIPDQVIPLWVTILLLLGVLAGVVFIGWFLRNYVGDLHFWTTYEETAEKNKKRRDILQYSADYLTHVLLDPRCERVIIVGHSMGTTVAHDSLLELARRLRAKDLEGNTRSEPDLEKIQHLVTLASPIDKIHYLFETRISHSYRYNAVVESTRGDLGTRPFADESTGRPLMHWMNFWDKADVASSPLYTPTNHKYGLQVDNFEIASHFFPEPVNAHGHYVRNTIVIDHIYRAFFNNQYNFAARFKQEGEKADYTRDTIGAKGKGSRWTRILQVMTLLIPWLVLFTLIFASLGQVRATVILMIAIGVDVVLLAFSGLGSWLYSMVRSKNKRSSAAVALAQA